MWWIYFVVPSGTAARGAPGALVRLGLRPHPAVRRHGRRRRRPARRGVLHRARHPPVRRGHPGHGRDTAGGLLRDALPAVHADLPDLRPVARRAVRDHRGWSSSGRCCWPAAGVDLFWCLLVLAASPWVTVVGYETIGHRHNQEVLDSLVDCSSSATPNHRIDRPVAVGPRDRPAVDAEHEGAHASRDGGPGGGHVGQHPLALVRDPVAAAVARPGRSSAPGSGAGRGPSR